MTTPLDTLMEDWRMVSRDEWGALAIITREDAVGRVAAYYARRGALTWYTTASCLSDRGVEWLEDLNTRALAALDPFDTFALLTLAGEFVGTLGSPVTRMIAEGIK